MKQFLCVIVFLHVVWQILAKEYNFTCPENELVDLCKNPCQPTCSVPEPPVCNFLVCNKGCVCRKGWLRNEETNQCVPPNLCPKAKPPASNYRCDANANLVWSQCGAGCVQTCKNLNTPIVCPAVCIPGCICKRGFVKDDVSGICIPKQKCPAVPTCNGINEEYSNCTSLCPRTCQTPCHEPVFCPAVCVEGCACKTGFIRDEASSQCILPDQCPICVN